MVVALPIFSDEVSEEVNEFLSMGLDYEARLEVFSTGRHVQCHVTR